MKILITRRNKISITKRNFINNTKLREKSTLFGTDESNF